MQHVCVVEYGLAWHSFELSHGFCIHICCCSGKTHYINSTYKSTKFWKWQLKILTISNMYKKTLFNIPRIKFVMKRRPYLVFLIGSQIILRSTSDNFACDLLLYSNLVLLKYDKYSRKSEPISEESDSLVFKRSRPLRFFFL